MNKINLSIGIVAVIALITGFIAYNKQPKILVGSQGQQGVQGERGLQGPQGIQGIPGKDGRDGRDGRNGKDAVSLGAVVSTEVLQNNFSVGGVRKWSYSQNFTNSTPASTTCSISAPAATSSVEFASFTFTQLASTSPVVIGWANGIQATTTKLTASTDILLPVGNPGGVVASSTARNFIVPPNTNAASSTASSNSVINFKIGSGAVQTPGSTVGTCKVVFTEI